MIKFRKYKLRFLTKNLIAKNPLDTASKGFSLRLITYQKVDNS